MTANLYQGAGGYTSVVGKNPRGHLPRPAALKQGSVGPVMSDMQNAMKEEAKQHEQAYLYKHGKD